MYALESDASQSLGLRWTDIQIEWERCNKVYGAVFMQQDFGMGGGSRDGLPEKSLGAAPVSVKASSSEIQHGSITA